jgi:hypothetical protein
VDGAAILRNIMLSTCKEKHASFQIADHLPGAIFLYRIFSARITVVFTLSLFPLLLRLPMADRPPCFPNSTF